MYDKYVCIRRRVGIIIIIIIIIERKFDIFIILSFN